MSRPIFPDAKLSPSELRLRRARKIQTYRLPDCDYAKGSHVGPPCGKVCRCGSSKVYIFPVDGFPSIKQFRCLDCWRKWR